MILASPRFQIAPILPKSLSIPPKHEVRVLTARALRKFNNCNINGSPLNTCLFVRQGTSTKIQRSDQVIFFDLRVKLPPVTTSL